MNIQLEYLNEKCITERLDGLCKKKPESSIKEWLQIPEDNYSVSEQEVVNDGKKRVCIMSFKYLYNFNYISLIILVGQFIYSY